jgi:D-mannonate dehydratase UxuA-like protein
MGPGGTRTCNQTVMTGRITVGFVDFAEFSPGIDRVRYALMRSYLVRNWCGGGVSRPVLPDPAIGAGARWRSHRCPVWKNAGNPNWRIPFRPDHGNELLDDEGCGTHPGYPLIGRLKGLA